MLKPVPAQDTGINISVVSKPPQETRSATQTFSGGMALRNYGEKEPRKPAAPTPTPPQPAAPTPPAGTDLVKLVADHESKLTEHEGALAELRQLITELQQAPNN